MGKSDSLADNTFPRHSTSSLDAKMTGSNFVIRLEVL
jgi:hypothetical protein